jgi:hypothetical protein
LIEPSLRKVAEYTNQLGAEIFGYNWRLIVLDPEAAKFPSKSAKPVFDLKNWGLIKPDIEEVTEKLGKPAFKIRIGRVEKHVIVEYVSALNGEVLYQEVVADVENEMSQALNRSLDQLKILSERIYYDDAVKVLAVDLLIRLGFNKKAARLFVVIFRDNLFNQSSSIS